MENRSSSFVGVLVGRFAIQDHQMRRLIIVRLILQFLCVFKE